MKQAADDLKLAPHASRQFFDLLEHFDFQVQQGCQFMHPFTISPRHGQKGGIEGEQAVQNGMEADVFLGREIKIQAGLLKNDANVLAHFACRTGHIVTCDAGQAGGWGEGCG